MHTDMHRIIRVVVVVMFFFIWFAWEKVKVDWSRKKKNIYGNALVHQLHYNSTNDSNCKNYCTTAQIAEWKHKRHCNSSNDIIGCK